MIISIGSGIKKMAQTIKEITGRFCTQTDNIGIGTIVVGCSAEGTRAIGKIVAPLHNEEVLIVVLKNGIPALGVFKVEFAEGVANPGHEDIVEVEQIHLVLSFS